MTRPCYTAKRMNYSGRQIRLRFSLAGHKLDGLLVSHLPNIAYLCGFSGSAGTLLLTEKSSTFFTDGRYTEQARTEVQGARVVIARQPSLSAAGAWLAAQALSRKKFRLGIEASRLSWESYRHLASIAGRRCHLKPAPPLVELARTSKDADEIDHIRAAAILGASLFDTALKRIRPGIQESEVAAEMEYAARRGGAGGMSFPTIVVSGPRTALPHGRAANLPISSNGFVVCDFGVILTGYCSDRTRTLYVGRPDREARRVYQAVREAQQAALETVRPGRKLGEIDKAARKVLQKHGLGRYFTHSTGHGVGLEIHESPRIAAGQTGLLRPGMVITIEPGAYLPGRWGVRIEDMVLVTDSGYEVLAPSSTKLIEL